jgi:hypothetical protein
MPIGIQGGGKLRPLILTRQARPRRDVSYVALQFTLCALYHTVFLETVELALLR